MTLYKTLVPPCVILFVVILGQNSAQAGFITFDDAGVYRHDFGPSDGRGALIVKSSIRAIPPFRVPSTRQGTNLNAFNSPIKTTNGNPAKARVITLLAVTHGNDLTTVPDGTTRFSGEAGNLNQSFSATGFWRLHLDPGDVLDSVALSGNLRGDVRLDPPLFGSATGSVSGLVSVDPFGSFMFATQERSSGGSFGLSVSATGGGITLSPPPGQQTASTITFTDLRRDIQPEIPYKFTLAGNLSAFLSGTGISGNAFSIANLSTDEFQLDVAEHPVPEPSSFVLFGVGTLGMFGYGWYRSRQQRVRVRGKRGHCAKPGLEERKVT